MGGSRTGRSVNAFGAILLTAVFVSDSRYRSCECGTGRLPLK